MKKKYRDIHDPNGGSLEEALRKWLVVFKGQNDERRAEQAQRLLDKLNRGRVLDLVDMNIFRDLESAAAWGAVGLHI